MSLALESGHELEGEDPCYHYADRTVDDVVENAGPRAQNTEDALVEEESAGFGTAEAEDGGYIDGNLELYGVY